MPPTFSFLGAISDWFHDWGHILLKLVGWATVIALALFALGKCASNIERIHGERVRKAEACEKAEGVLLEDALHHDVCVRSMTTVKGPP